MPFVQSRRRFLTDLALAGTAGSSLLRNHTLALTSRVFDGPSNRKTCAAMIRSPSATSYILILRTHSIAP
jgi:hypothetical protein